ncbi:MAG TPA: sodium:solute symporter, partial [Flavobacteriaceae bacterium]|nr:sodium:solute symporter [Flavobacteriaceae bacterium]
PDPAKQAALKSELSALNQQQLGLREEARALITAADKNAQTNDKDYVFIHFILNQLPIGLIGLLLAVILSAAMSSTASEINALGATTAVDLYQRHRPGRSEKHYLKITRYFTLVWGVIAILVACTAPLFDNLIQLVNIIGSIFYGNILGVFLAAFFLKSIRGSSIFLAAIINQAFVITLFLLDLSGVIKLPYLWLNVIGCAAVIAIALIIQFLQRAKL